MTGVQGAVAGSPPATRWINVAPELAGKRRLLTRRSLDNARIRYIQREAEERAHSRVDDMGTAPLELDLSRTGLLGYDVLPRLGALIKYRLDKGLPTRLVLPTETESLGRPNPVVDYLQTWRFGQFVETITGQSFISILDDHSKEAWESWQLKKSRYARYAHDPEGEELVQLSSSSYVRLTPLEQRDLDLVESASNTNERRYRAGETVEQSVSDWTRGLLRTIFDKTIVDKEGRSAGDLVGRIILSELLINSLVHSHTRLVYTYGQFSWREEEDNEKRGHFVLSVWDDAANHADLGRLLWSAVAAKRAESPAFGHSDECYHIWNERGYDRTVRIADGITANDVIRSRIDVPFGATVAGLTSDPSAPSAQIEGVPGDTVPELFQGYSGLGLHRVKLAAIRAIDGKLEYAGSTLRTSISALSEVDRDELLRLRGSLDGTEAQYRVDQQSVDKSRHWPLAGNLWTVWLPARILVRAS